MHYVYILQSEKDPERFYVGITSDLKRRFKEHNDGISTHTNKFTPWRLYTYMAFSEQKKAEQFEIYLKTGSDRAFMKRHF